MNNNLAQPDIPGDGLNATIFPQYERSPKIGPSGQQQMINY
jgi:hypothetical protein